MATLLSITKNVLRRLREDYNITDTTSDDYVNLIASFVADIAAEVNESGPGWTALDHTINVAVTSSTRQYDLSATVVNGGNVDNSDSPTNNQSTLLYDPDGRPQAWLFDDSSDDDGERMFYLEPNVLERLYQQDRDLTNEKPVYFTLQPTSDFDGYTMFLWPIPSASKHIRIRFNTPETELDPDTDENTTIKVPARLVRLGALWLALNERGEEIGEPGNIAELRYRQALGAAVENEIRTRERQGYYDWSRN